jgi:hypothetical protein
MQKHRHRKKFMKTYGGRRYNEEESDSDVDDDQPSNSDHDSCCEHNDEIGGGYVPDENGGWGGAGVEGNFGEVVEVDEPEEDDIGFADEVIDIDPVDLETAGLEWYLLKHSNKITRAMGDELLAVLKRKYNDRTLPKDLRTLMPKINREDVIVTTPADHRYRYANFQFRLVLEHLFRGLRMKDFPKNVDGEPTAEICLHVDGVSFTKSSRNPNEMWPVDIRVVNVKGLERELALVGLHHGGKPVAEELMGDALDDLDAFEEEPFSLEDGYNVRIKLVRVIADSPARNLLKSTMSYNSTNACERCECTGIKRGAMTFPPIYNPQINIPRTNERFRNGNQIRHHKTTGKKNTPAETRIPSVFEQRRCCDDLDMVYDFILDPMHLCYLCAGKRFIFYLFEKKKHGKPKVNIRGEELQDLNQIHYDFSRYCPKEFARKPKQMTGSGSLKATEIRQFFHYTGVALFLGRVSKKVSDHFLMYHCALRILCDPEAITNKKKLNRAEHCMRRFVQLGRQNFGFDFVSFSVHSQLHMTDEVRYNKLPLEDISAFISENSYRHLRRHIRSGNKPVEQIIGGELRKRAFEKKWWPGGVRQKNAGRPKVQFKRKRHEEDQNEEGTRHRVCITEVAYYNCNRQQDRYCEVIEDGVIVHIRCDNFVEDGPDSYVEGRQLRVERQEEVYRSPILASELGIFLDSGVYRDQHQWPISSIKRKLFRLPFLTESDQPRHVIIPLLHKALPNYFD